MTWAHRIPFPKHLEREDRQAVFDWLNDTFGLRSWHGKQSSLRWQAEGGKDKDGCDWFCFRSKKDAMLFKLTWHDVLKVVD